MRKSSSVYPCVHYIIIWLRFAFLCGIALESSILEYNGKKADLTKNELKILYYLFKNAGKICPRSDIVDFLWDNQLYIDDNALSVNMTRIREKLASIGLTEFIKTKHRQGYTL